MLKDRIFEGLVILFSILSIVPLIFILSYIFAKGFPKLFIPEFWISAPPVGQSKVAIETIGMNYGGIANGIIGTFFVVIMAAFIAVPLGVMTGVYLAENRQSKIVNAIEVAVDMIQGVPSIIFGIFINIWLVTTMKAGYSAIAGSISLALMMLPIVIKSTEETIKLIPDTLKEAAVALGTPYYKVILKIIVPAAMSGIVTGVLVGVTRIAGETAPLIFTAFGNPNVNYNVTQPMETLPTLIYNNARSASPNLIENAWGASAALVVLVLLLNILTKVVVNKWKVKF
ncbi:MAG: phosphate ABC transporter, permease protein PstA [Spirochaetes bacterium GWF1_51_8]|nr:MAG: phosphate ABC transporter, permease protein PstA [Spirochaetes bacterium GWF1_51_8]